MADQTITMSVYSERLREVRQGTRVIGSIMYVTNQAHLASGWRFIPHKMDIAKKYPAPSPAFDTPELALADAVAKIGG